jgi:hypothetical protein
VTTPIGTVGTAGTAREAAHDVLRSMEGDDGWTCVCVYDGHMSGHIPICDRVTAAIEADRATMAGELERAAVILTEFADGKAGHLGYSDADTCTCSRCRAKRWLTEYDRRRR